ncbi:MAG: hypothetical protein ACD_81C00153G0001 [uncultured bacterium]|nr:MAG: hypothetical protein ACD_81C00153G0001 [uncultured bacterium]
MTEKRRPGKKERLEMPYKRIFIEGNEVGQLYLLGSHEWDDKSDMVTVILAFSRSKYEGYFMALILSENFFFMNGRTIEDFTGKRKMMTGTLRQLVPRQGDQIGFIANIAERIGKVLGTHLPSLEEMG